MKIVVRGSTVEGVVKGTGTKCRPAAATYMKEKMQNKAMFTP
jgi:hypothetical protein